MFLLGVSITFNIIFIVLGIIFYKKIILNPYMNFLSNYKPSIEKDEFKEWKL